MIVTEAIDGQSGKTKDTDYSGENGECENLLTPQNKISINDFELVKVIGRGSFGKVFLVKRNGTTDYYAMKKLRKEVVAKRNLFIKTQGK